MLVLNMEKMAKLRVQFQQNRINRDVAITILEVHGGLPFPIWYAPKCCKLMVTMCYVPYIQVTVVIPDNRNIRYDPQSQHLNNHHIKYHHTNYLHVGNSFSIPPLKSSAILRDPFESNPMNRRVT